MPGSESETFACLLDRMLWPIEKATKHAMVETTKATTVNVTALANSTSGRFGMAAKVVRIIPVVYSELITSTPSTPIASCARNTPRRLIVVGSSERRSRAERSFQRLTRAMVINAPIPTVATTATKRVHTVERTERSFVAYDASAARTAPPTGGQRRGSRGCVTLM